MNDHQHSQPADDPDSGGVQIEVFFSGDEVLRAVADRKFGTFVHDLAMRAVANWEAELADEQPAAADGD